MTTRSLHDRLDDIEALLLALSVLCLAPTDDAKDALRMLTNAMLAQRRAEGGLSQ